MSSTGRRRAFTFVGVAVAASMMYGGFTAGGSAEPAAKAQSSGSPCGARGEFGENPRPGIDAAVTEVAARYQEMPTNDYFNGVGVCGPSDTMTVWRVPGSAEFDAEMVDVARRHRVGLQLVDCKYSSETLIETMAAIRARSPELQARDVRVSFMTDKQHDGGFVELGVQGDADEARKVLAEFGGKIRIEGGTAFLLL